MPPEDLVARLRAAGCVYAEEEAAQLREAACDEEDLESMTAQRVAGRPLEQLLGWAEFRGMRLGVSDGVFVPRARSGLVVDLALPLLRPGAIVLDLCCGVGTLAAPLLAAQPGIVLHAVDVDPAAVGRARVNLPGAIVAEGDLFDAVRPGLRRRTDVIVCNAPYVPTAAIATMPTEARDHERRAALDGGSDGLDVHRRIAAEVGGWLAPGGTLVIETGRAQAPLTAALFADAGLAVRVETDDEVDGTAVVATQA